MIAVNWTEEKLAEFKKEYATAERRRRDCFKFNGHEFYTGYAKYLIEYLEQDFKAKGIMP